MSARENKKEGEGNVMSIADRSFTEWPKPQQSNRKGERKMATINLKVKFDRKASQFAVSTDDGEMFVLDNDSLDEVPTATESGFATAKKSKNPVEVEVSAKDWKSLKAIMSEVEEEEEDGEEEVEEEEDETPTPKKKTKVVDEDEEEEEEEGEEETVKPSKKVKKATEFKPRKSNRYQLELNAKEMEIDKERAALTNRINKLRKERAAVIERIQAMQAKRGAK